MKTVIRWLVFWYAAITGHDEYQAESGTRKFRFLNWLYDGDAEPMFNMQMPCNVQVECAKCGESYFTDGENLTGATCWNCESKRVALRVVEKAK